MPRILNPTNIEDIASRLAIERIDVLNKFEKAMGKTVKFSQAATTAIGDISTGECIQGIIDFFAEEMRKS